MKPTLLLIGYRAYGDWLYAAPSLARLFDKYEVHLETNPKGYELFHDDPRFSAMTVFDVYRYPQEDWERIVKERWKHLVEELQPDRVINLWRTLETSCIAERYQPEFHEPREQREAFFGGKDFYAPPAEKCGIEIDNLMGLHFTDEAILWGKRWAYREENYFNLIMVPTGSCAQKVYPDMPRLAAELCRKHSRLKVYLLGDSSTAGLDWGHERIKNLSGQVAVKQSIYLTKHANFVFGGETGMLVAAGMFGTPKMMLCTSSSVYQCCGRHENDFSVQSAAKCSPCYRAIYCAEDCEGITRTEDGKDVPSCVYGFDYDHIFETISRHYEEFLRKGRSTCPSCEGTEMSGDGIKTCLSCTGKFDTARACQEVYDTPYLINYKNLGNTSLGLAINTARADLVGKYASGPVLDFGSGARSFAAVMSSRGYDIQCFDINQAAGDCVIERLFQRYQAVTFWDTLEHLDNPLPLLAGLNTEYVFICTPNLDNFEGEDLRQWKHYKPTEHIHYFNQRSLPALLGQAGFEVVDVLFDESSFRVDGEKNIITIVGKKT